MALSKKQTEDICLQTLSNHKTCRYLAQDDLDSKKFYCLKKSVKKAIADTEVGEFMGKMKKAGQDPNAQGLPLGDNCTGYPIMGYLEQGYDVD